MLKDWKVLEFLETTGSVERPGKARIFWKCSKQWVQQESLGLLKTVGILQVLQTVGPVGMLGLLDTVGILELPRTLCPSRNAGIAKDHGSPKRAGNTESSRIVRNL